MLSIRAVKPLPSAAASDQLLAASPIGLTHPGHKSFIKATEDHHKPHSFTGTSHASVNKRHGLETQGEPQTWNAQGTCNFLIILILLLASTSFPRTRWERGAVSRLISAAAPVSAERPPGNLGCSRRRVIYHVFEIELVERSCSAPKRS